MNDLNALLEGEPPTTPTEERLGQFIADVQGLLLEGLPIIAEDLLSDRPDLVISGKELIRDLVAFNRVSKRAMSWSGSQVTPDRMGMALPQPFPKEFNITRLLGEGNYGRVWLAEDRRLPRQVALKTLRASSTSDAGVTALMALRKEAGFLVHICHPNVVRVYDWRQSGEDHYLILEYVAGGSLDNLVKDGPLPWQRAARYVADVAEGLLVAHANGIIHRDLKPANILWDSVADEAKLTDFGVAGRLADSSTAIGTSVYMAPEAFRGRALEASDVYGLAATLFRLVVGDVPFRGQNLEEQVNMIECGLPNLDPRLMGLPEALEEVIRKGLTADPNNRPQLREFADRLRGAFNHSLADDLAQAAPGRVGLQLGISREASPGRWESVAGIRRSTGRLQRDMRRVPREPESVQVRTGEWVRIEVTADRDGFVTVFNIGPTGNLNVLYPDRPTVSGSVPDIRAGRPLLISDVVFEPPAGRERVFAVWSQVPLDLTERTLRSLTVQNESGVTGSRPYRASRDMRKVKDVLAAIEPVNRDVAILELVHSPRDSSSPATGG